MIITQDGTAIKKLEYKDEDEFQSTLFARPELLSDGETTLHSVKREVSTEAGPIDLLSIDDTGKLVVVEVKLGRNGESRRKVAAQIIDYVSAISNLSYFELNEATNNALSEVISNIPNANNIPSKIDADLHSGNVRLVVVVDEINDDLLRIMQFLDAHTDFELDLFEVSKYAKDNDILYSSNPIIKSSTQVNKRFEGHQNNPILDEVMNGWNNNYSELGTAMDNAFSYRQIRMSNWPIALHYEFTKIGRNHFIEVRLDNELPSKSQKYAEVSRVLELFDQKDIMGYKVDAKRYNDKVSRLVVQVDENDATNFACKIMKELILMTKESVNKLF